MKHQKAVNITKRAEMLQKYRASALFMRRSVQRKYAAKVTHRLHGEKGRRNFPSRLYTDVERNYAVKEARVWYDK